MEVVSGFEPRALMQISAAFFYCQQSAQLRLTGSDAMARLTSPTSRFKERDKNRQWKSKIGNVFNHSVVFGQL